MRKIISQEYAQAHAEIADLGAVAAYQRSCERHDARLAAAPDASTLACKAGCSWCCHFSVDVRAVEVFGILAFIENHLPPQQQQRVRKEIEINSTLLSNLPELERVQRNIKCPFLDAGRCVIYAARPQTCRNYHATNVAGCQKSYEEPENLDIDPDFAPLVYQVGGAHVDAFSKAMRDVGFDVSAYELSTALTAALVDVEGARQRFEAKKPPFVTIQGTDLPLDFMELDE